MQHLPLLVIVSSYHLSQVMGSSFLSFLEAQAKMLSMASDIMAPLGAYKEVGKGLSDSPTSSVVKEATVGWLAAAQVS